MSDVPRPTRIDLHRTVATALGLYDEHEGRYIYASIAEIAEEVKRLKARHDRAIDDALPRRKDEWTEETGAALWWKFPVVEPPYCGTPLDDDFPDYVTHWTPVPHVIEPVST